MSVINKMLRDLDQRNSEPAAERKHTVSVAQSTQAPRHRRQSAAPRAAILALLLLAVAGAAWWGWQQMHTAGGPSVPPPPAVATVALAPVAAPVAVVAAPEASAPQTVFPYAPPAAPASKPVLAAPVPAAAVTSAPGSHHVNTPLKIETTLKLPKAVKEPPAETVAPTAQAASSAPTVAPGQRMLQAGREAQVQAQALWNSGAKEAAMDLLQQAISNLERGLASEPVPAQAQLLSTLARDLTRMQLADGRAGAAWDLLVRLEPLVRNDPDLWAVRGNAAQRLGRHQDSAHAYMAALQIRPNEQRWLLGAAVSLAAAGQTAAAAEMAEKARAVGSISPEVQAYLRQAGVPLKEK